MPLMEIDNVPEDMVLGEKLLGPGGNVLLSSGTRLTASLIQKIKSLGISKIPVSNTVLGDEEDAQALLPKLLKDAEHRFSHVRGDPIMEELLSAVCEYLTEKGGIRGD